MEKRKTTVAPFIVNTKSCEISRYGDFIGATAPSLGIAQKWVDYYELELANSPNFVVSFDTRYAETRPPLTRYVPLDADRPKNYYPYTSKMGGLVSIHGTMWTYIVYPGANYYRIEKEETMYFLMLNRFDPVLFGHLISMYMEEITGASIFHLTIDPVFVDEYIRSGGDRAGQYV